MNSKKAKPGVIFCRSSKSPDSIEIWENDIPLELTPFTRADIKAWVAPEWDATPEVPRHFGGRLNLVKERKSEKNLSSTILKNAIFIHHATQESRSQILIPLSVFQKKQMEEVKSKAKEKNQIIKFGGRGYGKIYSGLFQKSLEEEIRDYSDLTMKKLGQTIKEIFKNRYEQSKQRRY